MHFDDINLDKNYSPSGAYGRSKLANILFTVELAKRLNGKFVIGGVTIWTDTFINTHPRDLGLLIRYFIIITRARHKGS